jgi:hypothetical protein
MAIEAVRQLSDPQKTTTEYKLSECKFSRPITIPENAHVESHFELRQIAETDVVREYSFLLCSLQDQTWVQNCSGTIREAYATVYVERHQDFCPSLSREKLSLNSSNLQHPDPPRDSPLELKPENWEDKQTQVAHELRTVERSALYNTFNSMGLKFGPAFQSLSEVSHNSLHQAYSTVLPYTWTGHVSQFSQNHVIHPVTLDGIFQTILAALTQGGQIRAPTEVPTSLKELYLKGLDTFHHHRPAWRASPTITHQSETSVTSSAMAWENGSVGQNLHWMGWNWPL